jgi:hypothetical protein
VTVTRNPAHLARRIVRDIPDIDGTLPLWARRTNPIVRRQLGMYWRVFPPQRGPILKWFVVQSVVVALTVFYSWLMTLVLLLLLASILMLPAAFFIYGRALAEIINTSSNAMADEFKNDTLTLLRTTPLSTLEIILSKVSAAVWRRVDELDQVITMALWLGLPVIALTYLPHWQDAGERTLIPQALTITTFGATLLRLPLEMFMVASLGAMMGAATRLRSSAFVATASVVFFYFLLLNLPRLLPLSWSMEIIVNAVLPLILPVIVTGVALSITLYLIRRE